MRIKEGFVLRDVAGQTMVIATGEASKEFRGMIRLNETGRCVWKGLIDGNTPETIVDALTEEFSVSREQAQADVEKMISEMISAGFLVL